MNRHLALDQVNCAAIITNSDLYLAENQIWFLKPDTIGLFSS